MNFKIKLGLIAIIIVISLYHYFFQTRLEKIFFKTYFGYDNVKRPMIQCKDYPIDNSILCLGMPSGHAETITIISLLLYSYKIISLQICILLIVLISLQRIYTGVHTIFQVIIGIFFGYIYFTIYKFYDLSVYSFLVTFFVTFIIILLIYMKIKQHINI
jgi:membrane-associated phospholipid phosphatase